MASAPLNWLLKIGGATLKTTAKTLSEAVNTLHDSVTNLGTTVTNLGTSKADASATTTALNNLETSKLNISDLLSLEEIEASTSLTGKGVTAESIKSLNNSLTNLGGFTPIIDETTGQITGYKTTIGGADTVFPFSGDITPIVLLNNSGNLWDGNYSFQKDYRLIIVYVASGSSTMPAISLNFSGSITLEQNTSNLKVKIAYKQNVKTGESLNYSANAYITGLIIAFE